MTRFERTFRIVNKMGLHARPAARLVQTANRFEAEITLEKDGQHANAKSIMGVLMLAAPPGTDLQVAAEGDDAEEAVLAIGELISEGFGEELVT